MFRHLTLPALLLSAAVLAACGSDAAGPGQPEPVAQVVLQAPPAQLATGQSVRLSAVVRGASGAVLNGRTIAWTSSEPSVGRISADGQLTAGEAGTTIVTATSEGKQAQATIRVLRDGAVASVQLRSPPQLVAVGHTVQLVAVALNAGGEELPDAVITWRSSDPAVATIAADGQLTALAAGTTLLEASSAGKSAQAELRVAAEPLTVARIVIVQGDAAQLYIGQSLALRAEARTADDRVVGGVAVQWISNDPSIAAVDAGGTALGVTRGQAQVIARVGALEDRITIDVLPNVQRIELEPTSLVLVVGETAQVTGRAYGGANVILDLALDWRSTDTQVATVVAPGRVTAHRAGVTTIRASAEGVTGEMQVLVVYGTTLDLTSANGNALPTTLFSIVEADGSTTRFDAHGGTLRLTGAQRFEQVTSVWMIPENALGVQATIVATGDVTRDPATGDFLFQPDSPAIPAFTGVKTSDRTLAVTQRVMMGASESTAIYTVR
jgi:uncharacterized protein YjdB